MSLRASEIDFWDRDQTFRGEDAHGALPVEPRCNDQSGNLKPAFLEKHAKIQEYQLWLQMKHNHHRITDEKSRCVKKSKSSLLKTVALLENPKYLLVNASLISISDRSSSMSSRHRRQSILLTIPRGKKLRYSNIFNIELILDYTNAGLNLAMIAQSSTATVANAILLRCVERETSHPASRMLMQENQKRNNLIAAGLKKFRVMP